MTGLTSNLNEVIERFQLVQGRASGIDFSEALVVGVNAARAEMLFRIFNSGKDAAGTSLGPYKGKKAKANIHFKNAKQKLFLVGLKKTVVGSNEYSAYELKRIKAGRQIRYKDLDFTDDLRLGIKTLKDGNQVVCVITNPKLILIADGQEQQLKTVIFALSNEERETLKTNTNAALKQLYDRLFNP